MKINKTKKGYTTRVSYTENGKRVYKTITNADKRVVEQLANEIIKARQNANTGVVKLTVGQVIDKYIENCSTLSPSTLRGYRVIRKNAFPELMKENAYNLTSNRLQIAVNNEIHRPTKSGRPVTAKTVKNGYGLISSALLSICDLHFRVRLPKTDKPPRTLPEPEEIIQCIKGSDIELPCLLAIWLSFSMSEILGLRATSLKNGVLTVKGVRIKLDCINEYIPRGKTSTRLRRQSVPPYILDLIEQTETMQEYRKSGRDDFLIKLTQAQIYYRLKKLTAGYGITFHDLRHIFASVMLTKLQVPEKIVQDEGGWKTPHTMKSVYSETFDSSRRQADEKRDAYFLKICTQSARPEKGNKKIVSPDQEEHNLVKPT